MEFSGFYEEDKVNGFFYFNGTSSVDFVVNEDICFFNLHMQGEFEIHSISVTIGDIEVPVSHMINTEYLYLTIFTDYKIPINTEIRATVSYRVQMPTGTRGLYLAYYTNTEGQVRYLASTQFESTGARMAFPCFDEPLLKATFKFSMKYNYDEYSAIFNTGIEKTEKSGTWTTNYYEQTMIMPTYLLAILVSDYHLESKGISDKGVSIRILGRKGWENQAHFALEEAKSIVDGMSDLFDYDYCGPFGSGECKSDQAAIPQFGAGAMENWGLITYREYYLFIDEDRDDFLRKRSATSILGHELMHQWFGNTVSCPWWDEIYINEAFGSIGGYLGLIYGKSNNEIDYQWEDEYLYGQTYSGLNYDGRITSRPMVNNANNGLLKVETPTEISRQFDSIAYDKAGSIMLMIRAIIGDPLWIKGLQNYIKALEFGSATWHQLLSHWDAVVAEDSNATEALDGMTITNIMEPYFRQMGYPVLKIQSNGDTLTIQTNRYLQESDNKLLPLSEFGYTWRVPLFINENGEERIHWLNNAGENFDAVYEVDIAPGAIINPNGNIWARINFDTTYINQMIQQHWSEEKLLARSIAKIFQDHYRMLTSENVNDFDVTIKTLLDLTWFLRGPNSDVDLDGHQNRWIIWREVDRMNIFGTLHNRVQSYLRHAETDSAEAQLFHVYRTYMYSKIEYFIESFYPDKYPENNDPAMPVYDIGKARMTEFAVSMAMRYGDFQYMHEKAHELAMLTVNGLWQFRDQSPDTRKTTFKAAVAHESDNESGTRPVTDYLIQQITFALENDIEIPENIRACTNKDVTNVIVPLYTGDCMLNAYFIALASVENLATALQIKEDLPVELQGDFLVNLASNPKVTRALISAYQSPSPLIQIESDFNPDQLNAFIRNGCNHFSSLADQVETAKWTSINFSELHQERVDAALLSCDVAWSTNNEFMKTHYQDIQEWFCENDLLNCDELMFDLYPFGFVAKEFNEWYLPRDPETGTVFYQPSHYDVSIDFDGLKEEDKTDGSFWFRGESTVYFTNTAKISTVNIHVDIEDFMTVLESRVVADGSEVPVIHMHHNSNYRLLTIYLENSILSGSSIALRTRYLVRLTDADTQGLYLSSFINSNGDTEYLTATQFESTHAREAFPCFDEPSLKATFDFKMKYRYRDEFTAIFNTDVKSFTDIGDDARENTYYRTVKMSTYLLAILVSTFNVEARGESPNGVGIRILGREDFKNETALALSEAMSVVDALSEYFDYDYCPPLLTADPDEDKNGLKCKSDQAGIPTFRSGAMENWGLITYREYYLHYDDRRDNFLVRRTLTRIIGHELIHQWFGNLVTCPWWDEIYINEAWGSIGGYLGMFKAESMAEVDYAWEDEYLATQTYSGLDGDARLTSRPMVNNMNNGDLSVDSVDEIRIQFDGIAYNKAGSVMLMIREIIGEHLWITGLQAYLKGQEFDTANWEQLLSYWDAAVVANQTSEGNLLDPAYTISEIFEPYFKQMGYPLLYVTQTSTPGTFEIKTERFLDRAGARNLPESVYDYKWHVPLIIKTADSKYIRWLIDAGNTATTYNVVLPVDSIIDPNANTWLRIRYENYVQDAITTHWTDNGISLTNANIAKMMKG